MKNQLIKEWLFIVIGVFLFTYASHGEGEIDYKDGPGGNVRLRKVTFENKTDYDNLFIAFKSIGGGQEKRIPANAHQTKSLPNLKNGYLVQDSDYNFGVNLGREANPDEQLQISGKIQWYKNTDEKNNILLSFDDKTVNLSLSFEYLPATKEVVISVEE